MTDQLREALKAEYLLLQSQYEAYDARVLSIKGLATPLLGAGVAVGVKEKSFTILAVTALVTLSLWALEATWKAFQYANRPRLSELEAWFRTDGGQPIAPFQIYSSWLQGFAEWRGAGAFLHLARQQFVMLPYVVILAAVVVGGVGLWLARHA